MTLVNETNTITEYKKRLGELVKAKRMPVNYEEACEKYPEDDLDLDQQWYEDNTIYNEALEDVLDLINSTN